MQNTTTYQPVPTRRRTARAKGHCYINCAGILCILIGIVLIIFGIFQFKKMNSIRKPSGYCRVNGFEVQRETRKKSTLSTPVWNIDIVEQLKDKDSIEKVVILRSNLKIYGSEAHALTSSALDEAQRQYSVSYC